VVDDIRQGRFPNDFKGSSLETVLTAITEQKQVFEGAAHPFYWKPKLRIPDIYESQQNKLAFGQFLEACLKATTEQQLLRQIDELSRQNIKGLGPAVASIVYFLHPTLIPPFNTAIVRGFNLLFGQKLKLGCWDSYLQMRAGVLQFNDQFRSLLSNDLGAACGLLFDIGAGTVVLSANAQLVLEQSAKAIQKRHKDVQADIQEEEMHIRAQHALIKIGKSLGYDVIVAANDRSKSVDGQKFSFLCLDQLPPMGITGDVVRTIDLIDVIWFEKGTGRTVCAFEVEKSTSIYSGILRLTDLALSIPRDQPISLYLVIPQRREPEVLAQLKRPPTSGL
jgi:type II restriction enzyme